MELQSSEVGKIGMALSAAQGEFPSPKKSAMNPHLKKKYADLGDIREAVQPTLSKHGLAFVHQGFDGFIATTLIHGESGQWLRTIVPVFEGNLKGAQGYGSGETYAKRYGLTGVTGVVADDDDDGIAASGNQSQRRSAPKQREQKPDPAALFDYLKDSLFAANDLQEWKSLQQQNLATLKQADKPKFDNLMDLGKKRAGTLAQAPSEEPESNENRNLEDIPF